MAGSLTETSTMDECQAIAVKLAESLPTMDLAEIRRFQEAFDKANFFLTSDTLPYCRALYDMAEARAALLQALSDSWIASQPTEDGRVCERCGGWKRA